MPSRKISRRLQAAAPVGLILNRTFTLILKTSQEKPIFYNFEIKMSGLRIVEIVEDLAKAQS